MPPGPGLVRRLAQHHRRRLPPLAGRRGPRGRAAVGSVDARPASSRKATRSSSTSPASPSAKKLMKRYDVVDFATPVTMFDAMRVGNSTRLVVTATGDFEQIAYQTDNQYVVEIKQRAARDRGGAREGEGLHGRTPDAELPGHRRARRCCSCSPIPAARTSSCPTRSRAASRCACRTSPGTRRSTSS